MEVFSAFIFLLTFIWENIHSIDKNDEEKFAIFHEGRGGIMQKATEENRVGPDIRQCRLSGKKPDIRQYPARLAE